MSVTLSMIAIQFVRWSFMGYGPELPLPGEGPPLPDPPLPDPPLPDPPEGGPLEPPLPEPEPPLPDPPEGGPPVCCGSSTPLRTVPSGWIRHQYLSNKYSFLAVGTWTLLAPGLTTHL